MILLILINSQYYQYFHIDTVDFKLGRKPPGPLYRNERRAGTNLSSE